MPNWSTITEADLPAVIVAKARQVGVGANDPVASALAEGISRVRRAVSTGNALDIDATKVPESLRTVAIRIALFSLMTDRLRMALTPDQCTQRDNDISDLKRISDDKIRVETPDNAAGSAEMQSIVSSETVQSGNSGNSREDLYRL